jgi:hypothetical protein
MPQARHLRESQAGLNGGKQKGVIFPSQLAFASTVGSPARRPDVGRRCLYPVDEVHDFGPP